MTRVRIFIALSCALGMIGPALSQQVSVPRIEQMPSMPAPYLMRDWKRVALGYDSLVFNFALSGTYLPLIWLNTAPVNYTSHNSFGLHTVVGTTDPTSAEAINCLPAVISATLAGVDKSSQNTYNWPLMCEEWFNRRPSQNVYKNHPEDDTGDDWWYETMPNIFFYQLEDLYPGAGDYAFQFTTVADRWLQAVTAMGGSTTPWQMPNMDHRGWFLQTMTPYDDGVHEPEASGAIAWLLYNAYLRTDSAAYRIGAEQSMEFLNSLTSNPAYELQLAYGTYAAARMNAEIGTGYDVAKMVNWCFDVGPLRSWGAILGNWGGYDCSGLIGEVNGSNDYAFSMNTFEQVGALVPMVRYDDRFARAIGKWVLNAANAARLFYPQYLPGGNQDSYQWSQQQDPNSTIAHEAMRQSQNGHSPYATGDAVSGGWGLTNLSLYSSSHAGILGGIIDTTDVPMILRLDVLKTDYYHEPAYPSYLYFNPYDTAKTVTADAGAGQHDLYDALTNSFLVSGVTGKTPITIGANSALLLVVTPSGGTVTYELEKLLVDGVVVDYRSGHVVANYPPRIKSLALSEATAIKGDTVKVYCTAADRDGDPLGYGWQPSGGSVTGSGPQVRWAVPESAGIFRIICIVSDGRGGNDTAGAEATVVAAINHPPVITGLVASPRKIGLDSTSRLSCAAVDPDSNVLSYTWTAPEGVLAGSGQAVTWTAPPVAGNYRIRVLVEDGQGGQTADSIGLEVRDFSEQQTGQMVAYYPFSGNANDSSGFNNNGAVHGALLVVDRSGNPSSAYSFNGTTSSITVPNAPSLNFQQSVTVNFWIKVTGFFADREQYPISHGNWQNRWKISITPNANTLRWTVKTSAGTKDLDSETPLALNHWYNVTVSYGGSDDELYLDGNLDAFSSWSGQISTTTIDLVIGQDLPSDQNYNFKGVLDDIRIYNYALPYQVIQNLARGATAVQDPTGLWVPSEYALEQNYPNPFNPSTCLRYQVPVRGWMTVKIYDMLGREVQTLVEGVEEPGFKSLVWSAERLPSGVYFCRLSAQAVHITRKLVIVR